MSEALATLNRALDATHTPCRDERSWVRDLWTSDSLDDLEAAAHRCAPCPVLLLCLDAGAGQKWSTWGGQVIEPKWRLASRGREAKAVAA